MADEKRYLDRAGVERLIQHINNALAGKMDIQDGMGLMSEEERAKLAELENYELPVASEDVAGGVKVGDGLSIDEEGVVSVDPIDWSEVQNVPDDLVRTSELDSVADELRDKIVSDLGDYVKTEDFEESMDELKASLTTVYHFRGSVADEDALAAIQNPEVGDVYNVESTGMNVGWTGEAWDNFGSVVDLSPYLEKEDVQAITIPELDEILYGGSRVSASDANGIAMAMANDQPEVVVTVSDDVAIESAINVPAGKAVTMKLGSNVLSGDRILNVSGDLTLVGGEVDGTGRSIIVNNGGSLTLDGTRVISENDCAISVSGGEVVVNSGEVEAQEVGIIATKESVVTINGGSLKGKDNFAIGGNGTAGQGGTTININGGYIEGNIQSPGYVACAIYHPNAGTLNITDGEIVSNGGCGVLMRGGQLNMSGGSIVATGTPGSLGKVGDSKVTVGPYAIVYDQKAKYPAVGTLGIAYTGGELEGTDGKLSVLVEDGVTPNISGLEY